MFTLQFLNQPFAQRDPKMDAAPLLGTRAPGEQTQLVLIKGKLGQFQAIWPWGGGAVRAAKRRASFHFVDRGPAADGAANMPDPRRLSLCEARPARAAATF